MIFINFFNYWLFLFEWKNKIYINIFLSFNLRIASFIFNFFDEELHWILKWIFNHNIIHYFDNFLFIQDSNSEFFDILTIYFSLFENLVKCQDNYIVNFIDIQFNTNFMKAKLSKNKHDHAFMKIEHLLHINIIIHHIFERLLKFLFFCAKVISLNRFFFRNLFNLFNRLSHFHLYIICHLFSLIQYDLL